MQVNDTLMGGNREFMSLEELEFSLFVQKPFTILAPISPIHFNGLHLSVEQDSSIAIDMSEHVPRTKTGTLNGLEKKKRDGSSEGCICGP